MTSDSTAERYASAINTSNLRVSHSRERCPADYMHAAGLSAGFGASLIRLRSEYDCVMSEHIAAQARSRQFEEVARKAKSEPDFIERRAAGTARAMLMCRLKSLAQVRFQWNDIALSKAKRARFSEGDEITAILASKCLDVWLAPNCQHCSGRGFNGGGRHEDSGPQVLCRHCSGTGKRHNQVGRTDEQRRLSAILHDTLEKAVEITTRTMTRKLSQT